MKKKIFLLVFCLLTIIIIIFTYHIINNENNNDRKEMDVIISKIKIIINDMTYETTIEDNVTAQEFIKHLPLELNMNDLNNNEKYYYFDNKFQANSAKVNRVNAGDLMLFGDNCLVLFYDSFDTDYSYTKIGKIDNPDRLKENLGKENTKILFIK